MISYIGGKAKIGRWIKDYIPRDIETYVESFGGMFWVFYNLDISRYNNLKRVVYNDVNDHNVNLFHCIQNPEKLSKEVEKFPYQDFSSDKARLPIHEELYNRFQQELFHQNNVIVPPDYESAAKYVYIVTQVYSGMKPATNKLITLGRHHSKFGAFIKKLKNPQWLKYFDMITDVEHKDFEDVIKKYDSPTTYFYADPPYWKTEDYYSNMDFDVEDHERFANVIKQIQGRFGISYYDFPKLSEWFPKDVYTWESERFTKNSAGRVGVPVDKGTELLIMNYADFRLKYKGIGVEY